MSNEVIKPKKLGGRWSPDDMRVLSDKLMSRGEEVACVVLLQASVEIEQLQTENERLRRLEGMPCCYQDGLCMTHKGGVCP